MRAVGRLEDIPCYECTHEEFVETKSFLDYKNIYIIGQKVINKNRIIGTRYDDQIFLRNEPYAVYYFKYVGSEKKEEKRENVREEEIDFNELVNQIKFEDYTSTVDSFFDSLK